MSGKTDQIKGRIKEAAGAQQTPPPGQVRNVHYFPQTEKHYMITYSRFQEAMIRVLGSALLVMGGALVGVGCERQGPVEKAGKQVDQAVEAAKDKLNPEGPVEKAGKKVDQAVDDAKGK